MARYNLIQLGTIYLTSNGLSNGSPCKTQVNGLSPLKTDKTGQVFSSANGTPYAQLVDVDNKGTIIEIITEWMSKTVFDSIVTLINNTKNSAISITLVIAGDLGTFNLSVIPGIPDDIIVDEFRNGYIKGAKFRFVTT